MHKLVSEQLEVICQWISPVSIVAVEKASVHSVSDYWYMDACIVRPLKASVISEGHPILKCCQPHTGFVYAFIDLIFEAEGSI